MTFSDDDLRFVKSCPLDPMMKWRELIARLEAAEEIIKYLAHIPDEFEKKNGDCLHCQAMKTWFRSKERKYDESRRCRLWSWS